MGRKANYSSSESAAVREHFGLSQEEMGRFVGVSAQMIAHEEAGRRSLGIKPMLKLLRLFSLLPPPRGIGPADPPDPELPVPPAPPLVPRAAGVPTIKAWEDRRFDAEFRAFRLRLDLKERLRKRRVLRRLQQVLPQVAALPPESFDTEADQKLRRAWLDWHQYRVDSELAADGPLGLAELALLRWRLWLLETEEAQLRHWLEG